MSLLGGGLVGNSMPWKQVLEKIRLGAPTASPVLVYGETGTGKEQIAKAIHALSGRADKPFIALNCSAISSSLAESELFGHEKGAFTGAIAARKGRFELADHGTLFLDELGDLPLELQPKLLRAVQQGTFERLGSEKTIRADVRIISATNANLEEKVKRGQFREDLFYRLNVFPVHAPPLRERKGDIVFLVHHFIDKLLARFGYTSLAIAPAAVNLLLQHNWPGNVRELENTIERAMINCRGRQIEPQHIYLTSPGPGGLHQNLPDDSPDDFAAETRKIILKALQKCNGKIYGPDGAASLLKLKPTTLQSKMKKLGLQSTPK
jgi:transcriptional regulator with GAF, ATPase, and Fis domain